MAIRSLLVTSILTSSLMPALAYAQTQSQELTQPADDTETSGQTAPGPTATVSLGAIYLNSGSTEGMGFRGNTVGFGGVETPLLAFPRAVSVVTADMMAARNITSVFDALELSNGVTLAKQDDLGERSTVLVRGFESTSIQVDGSPSSASKNLNLFDTAIYDRVEILRGPSGVMQGAREPGATVNLVHKRPTDSRQLVLGTEIGSWDHLRATVDWGGPVTSDGRLRARFVGAGEKANSFIDVVEHDRILAYGVLEYDLTDNSMLSVGATRQTGSEVGSRGLPAYDGGPLLDVPRRTFAGPGWANTDLDASDVFAEYLHTFDNGIRFTLKGSYQDRERDGKLAFADAAVDPATGMTRLIPEWRIDREKAKQLTAGLELPFTLWGREQRVLVLADYQHIDFDYDRARASAIPFNIYDPDYNIPEPEMVFNRFDQTLRTEYGLTVQSELRPADDWTLLLGGRLGTYEAESKNLVTGLVTSEQKLKGEFTPYMALQHDLTPGSSAYVSYASVFAPQTAERAEGGYVEPRKGSQIELGYKREIGMDALLQLALFQIEDRNRAVRDLNDPTGDYSVGSGKVRSRGFEAEITGEILDSFHVSAGYTYLNTKFLSDPDTEGEVFEPRAPRHSLKLWGRYDFHQQALQGWSLAGGVNIYSARSRTMDGVTLTQGGLFTADLQLGYQFNENAEARLTVSNIFDREYYESVGYTNRQNYYGAPRAVLLQITNRF